MCGLAGIVGGSWTADAWREQLRRMSDALRHRGPDDSGEWFDAEVGVGLSHRRLSILDLSEEGAQPMRSAGGRFVLVYNGEIYNFTELRQELEAHGATFRGHSDTEVLLAAIETWGFERTLPLLNGMFALALWDATDRRLLLARDRVGIKPLYYGGVGNAAVFGSELKAIRCHPGFGGELDAGAVAWFLNVNFVPAPHSIYRGIHKLEPGHWLSIDLDREGKPTIGRPQAYWSMRDEAARGQRSRFSGSFEEAVEALDAQLRDAVGARMVADVPLGAFLSGGIDSSVVVAMMQAQSSRPVQTFSIGFHEQEYNEAPFAKVIAEHLGTRHHELMVSPQDALDVIPRLPQMFDEPFADSSQIPTYLVSELARRHVTVSLSGDGGDELFAGYRRYGMTMELWSRIGWIPRWSRRAVAGLIEATPKKWLDRSAFWMAPLWSRYGSRGTPGDKLKKMAEILSFATIDDLYGDLMTHWKQPVDMVMAADRLPDDGHSWRTPPELEHRVERMCFSDSVGYLPDDVLAKVDRASMAVSLEARVPILDHRVVELAWSLPLAFKVRDGRTKAVLRSVLDRYVPSAMVDRPKMGFGVPIDHWLRGPLREWGESLLDEKRLREEGIFDPQPIRTKWEEHVSGTRDWHYYLWDLLMFQAWRENCN